MKFRAILTATAAAGLLATGALAQHEGHQTAPSPSTENGAKPEPAAAAMGGMMASQMETAKMVDQLVKSFEAIEADGSIPKEKLAAHGALLRELQAKLQGEAKKMEMMHSMMGKKIGDEKK